MAIVQSGTGGRTWAKSADNSATDDRFAEGRTEASQSLAIAARENCNSREPFADEEGIHHSGPGPWRSDGPAAGDRSGLGVEIKMPGGCFHTLKLSQLAESLEGLHQRVAAGHGRIEITRDGCDDVCILISKTELESLERALDILSQTGDYQSMCETLSSVASECNAVAAPQTA